MSRQDLNIVLNNFKHIIPDSDLTVEDLKNPTDPLSTAKIYKAFESMLDEFKFDIIGSENQFEISQILSTDPFHVESSEVANDNPMHKIEVHIAALQIRYLCLYMSEDSEAPFSFSDLIDPSTERVIHFMSCLINLWSYLSNNFETLDQLIKEDEDMEESLTSQERLIEEAKETIMTLRHEAGMEQSLKAEWQTRIEEMRASLARTASQKVETNKLCEAVERELQTELASVESNEDLETQIKEVEAELLTMQSADELTGRLEALEKSEAEKLKQIDQLNLRNAEHERLQRQIEVLVDQMQALTHSADECATSKDVDRVAGELDAKQSELATLQAANRALSDETSATETEMRNFAAKMNKKIRICEEQEGHLSLEDVKQAERSSALTIQIEDCSRIREELKATSKSVAERMEMSTEVAKSQIDKCFEVFAAKNEAIQREIVEISKARADVIRDHQLFVHSLQTTDFDFSSGK